MSDWKQEAKLKGNEALKAAAVILGLLAACIFGMWLLMRSLHKSPPAPAPKPPAATP